MPQSPNTQNIASTVSKYYANNPPSPQNISDAVRDYYAKNKRGSGNFGAPVQSVEDQIDLLPNADKLTKFERKIYGALPGVTTWMEGTRIGGATVAEQLEKFDKGWLGKALNWLDVGAEGLERFVGTGEQAIQHGWMNFDWDKENLTAAWYAGSLYWETANLPQLARDDDGKITGMTIPEDLPGVDGMVDARIKIKRMMEQGVPPKEALAQVREEYYNGLGALALRAQLNDTYGHVLGDPINLLTSYIKPLEILKVRRFSALTTKLTGGVEEIIEAANKATDLMKVAENAEDALKYADEAYELANMAGDTRRATEAATSAAEVAKKAGRLEDAARYERRAVELATMPAKAAAKFTEESLVSIGKKQMNLADKAAIFLTGGDPLRPAKLANWTEKIPIAGKFIKAFQLTPESKARELLTLVGDNIGTNVVARLINSPNAEAEFVGYMRRVSKGATGLEFGHAMMTLEGRTVQAFTKGSSSIVEHVFETYQKLGKERSLLKVVSDLLGEAPSKLLRQMDEAPEVLMDMITKKRGLNPVIDALVASGELTPDALRTLKKTLGDMPYNREMFFATVLDAIETQAARQAVVQFGVKSKGVLTRWSDAMKAAESLAFLRLSPAYPFRNKINNEFTMIARGLFGLMPDSAVDKFWSEFGSTPKRLSEAFGPAQEKAAKAVMSEAEKVIEDALKGGYYGPPDKVKDFFQKIDLGKLDTAKYWGQKIEQRARRRAMTMGTQQYLRKYNSPKSIKTYLSRKTLDAIENLNPEFRQHFDNAIRAAGAMEKKFDELLGSNLALNTDSILDEVSQGLGTEVREMLGDELVEHIHQGLPRALNEGTIDSFKLQTRQMMEQHVDDLFNKQVENVVEHIKAQAVAGGPSVWAKKLGEAQDIFWGAHIEHSIRMPEATRLAREASSLGDYKAARALWVAEQADAAKFYGRAFRRVDAYIQGLEEGVAELGKRGVQLQFSDVRRAFGEWQDGWKAFFVEKNKLMDDFWKMIDETPKGQRPTQSIDDVQKQIKKMYDNMAVQEDNLMQQIDDSVASMIEDPDAQKAYMNARDTLSEMRKADRKAVNELYRQAAELPAEERQALFNEFWRKRTQRYQQMRSIDAAGTAIQQGDPQAVALFSGGKEEFVFELDEAKRAADVEEVKKAIDIESIKEQTRKLKRARAAEEGEFDIFRTAEEFGVPTSTTKGTRNYKRVLNTVNKYLPEGEEKFKNLADVPEDVARKAFEKRAVEKGLQIPARAPEVTPEFIANVEKVIPNPPPLDLGMDMMNYGRSYGALDSIVDTAKAAAQRTPTMLADLPTELQDEVRRAVKQVKNDFASTRYQALKFGEWRADSALLNYNRRTNFDNWLGHGAPFAFWTTSSMFQWAIESIDRPAMLTNYLRTKKLFATAGLQRDGQPSRAKGKIRVPLPFAPDWMGEQFIDPLRTALPFDNWLSPFEQMQKNSESLDGRTERLLEQQLADGDISQEEYEEALSTHAGATWDFARTKTAGNDNADRYDAWDFATTLTAPHAPLMWAFNAATGQKDEIGSFAPLSKIMRNAATVMGVEDWQNSKWNIEAKVRRQMGLPAYDKWDDYRIDRALSNLSASGEYTVDEVKEAMAISALVQQGKVTPDQAKQMSEAYKEGVKRSNQEFTGGLGAFGLSLLGIPVTSVPEGEMELRAMTDDFNAAYKSYKEANDSLQKYIDDRPFMEEELAQEEWAQKNPKLANAVDNLTEFFDKNPEYETRLGLFDSPEERLHKFSIDQVWQRWNELPKVNRDEVSEHLGSEFQDAFLNKDTRSYDDVPTELMSVWLKLMNVDPLGGLTADQRMLVALYGKVQFTDAETANRVETFYQHRNTRFKNWYNLQTKYYELPKGQQRKAFLAKNPALKSYWDFRKMFMVSNPDLVPYMTDDPKAIERAKYQVRTKAAVPTAVELQQIASKLPPDVQEILYEFAQSGDPLPPVVIEELEYFAQSQGLDPQTMTNILGAGLYGIR